MHISGSSSSNVNGDDVDDDDDDYNIIDIVHLHMLRLYYITLMPYLPSTELDLTMEM